MKLKRVEKVYGNIGSRIRHFREAHGITQAEFAEAVGLTRTSIVNIEAGRQRIMLHDVALISELLGLTCENFMRGLWK